jgi:hypothetical protein
LLGVGVAVVRDLGESRFLLRCEMYFHAQNVGVLPRSVNPAGSDRGAGKQGRAPPLHPSGFFVLQPKLAGLRCRQPSRRTGLCSQVLRRLFWCFPLSTSCPRAVNEPATVRYSLWIPEFVSPRISDWESSKMQSACSAGP